MADPIGNPNAFDIQSAEAYTGYRQSSNYEYDPGVFVLPVASRTPKVVVGRVHAGLGMRTVKVAASKRGSPPIIPAATDTDQDTLIHASVNLPLPAFLTDSPGYHWTVTGTYSYVTTGDGGPRIPGKSYLPAGQYPFPLPLQDAAVELLSAGTDMKGAAGYLEQQIPMGGYLWPFTVMPPQFFNSILLRDQDTEAQTNDLVGGGILPGLGD